MPPRHAPAFDPWTSSSTGHQRADRRPAAPAASRDARARQLNAQLRPPPPARSVADLLARPGLVRPRLPPGRGGDGDGDGGAAESVVVAGRAAPVAAEPPPPPPLPLPPSRPVFDGVVVYVNGSTYPLVSDHRLKHMLSANGAQLAQHLARRRVTHVILGRPAARGHGAGGGLAAGKLDRQVQQTAGCGVRFVGVEWVLESLKAGRRLPEARFSNLKMASTGQDSVYARYSEHAAAAATADAESPTETTPTP